MLCLADFHGQAYSRHPQSSITNQVKTLADFRHQLSRDLVIFASIQQLSGVPLAASDRPLAASGRLLAVSRWLLALAVDTDIAAGI